ncbi:MAG: SDR family NAD(P)-dependent oxidoreductase [Alphaproteobacteria bacterium]
MTQTALITGAAIGMGAMMANKLADRGWTVLAGVLPSETNLELNTDNANIHVIEQDVSSDASVKASAEQAAPYIENGLHLVINNAGIANIAQGVVEGLSIEELHRIFEINTFGQLRVVQAFLPALRNASGTRRIINFASGAIVVNPPGSGAYNMSKHAVHGMTMTLRHELAAFGVEACSILPGGVKTAMTANSHETTKAIWDRVAPAMRDIYFPVLGNTTTKVLPDMLEKTGNSPDYLTDEVLKIATGKKALKPSYLVGKEVKPMIPMRRWLSESGLEKAIRSQFKIPSSA